MSYAPVAQWLEQGSLKPVGRGFEPHRAHQISMMYLILKDGTKVNAPTAPKSTFGMEYFMQLAKQDSATLVMLDAEISYESILKRYERLSNLVIK